MARPTITEFIAFLPAPAWEATRRFYEQVLGLPCALEQIDCCIYRIAGAGYVGFCRRAEAPHPAKRVILTLVTQEVDAWYAHFQAHGVEIVKPPTYNERYQIYHLFARDPNGYLIEVQRFDDPRWQG
ncbi:MAG: glyoxalase [Armatimonadetes bacterium CP1_7O]|nr:MAG: glyoxalase [Armatimonadetes bacterium CP1_7O]RMH08340.1 MAG: VOC family protein [Armatimonadota bacterium]